MSTGIRSAVCAPLWLTGATAESDQVIGLVYLDSLQRSHSFTEDDLRMVTALANIAAAKIENTRLLEESIEKRAMEEDMRRAAEIQRGLLPASSPRVDGWGVVGSNKPCHTVGGDYYDFVCEGPSLMLALGDVSGKGTGAALLMAVLRAAVRAHWIEFAPADAMARLDTAKGVLSYVNAGHNPPLLVRASGEVRELEEGGMVLGMFESVPYDDGAVEMKAGDALVIFSDGVTETFNRQGEEFGVERLVEVVRRGRGLDAPSLEAEILRALDAFAAGSRATDDRTLIVLKRY
jgi:phosphoserine phosphatase RsbU/P